MDGLADISLTMLTLLVSISDHSRGIKYEQHVPVRSSRSSLKRRSSFGREEVAKPNFHMKLKIILALVHVWVRENYVILRVCKRGM